ncbi:MAG: adenosylcobinamide-GDP ribazoletransferase [Hyphomicrobiales bacterium]|nr:adenosylcobinamide-GDP ribazoletransferase [Hyphomicrobiales bacterium]
MTANTPPDGSPQGWSLNELLQGFRADWRFLTILPGAKTSEASASELDIRSFPVVGGILGAIGAAIYLFANMFGLPAIVCALLAMAGYIASSGLLHEDGLGDIADSLGGQTQERRLEILHDSRIGTFGVAALLLGFLLRLATLTALGSVSPVLAAVALLGAGAFSRAAMGLLARALPNAREDGLSATLLETPPNSALAVAALLGILPGVILLGMKAVVLAILLGGALLAGLSFWAKRQLGGRTGDVLGASQIFAETGFLLAACLVFATT